MSPYDATNDPAPRLTREDLDGDGRITLLDLTLMAQDFGQSPPLLNSIDRVIATRGIHQLPHDITLPDPLPTWSWGHHATEDTPRIAPDSATVAAWLVVMRDASQLNAALAVRFNVRRIALRIHHDGTWSKIYDGQPGWRVDTNPDTTSGYVDILPRTEADGSWSFDLPPGLALHMAMGPWPSAPQTTDGVLAIVEGRLLGDASAVLAAKIGLAAGADYRGPGGGFSQGMDTPGYYAAGFGQFRLLRGDWTASDMLSSVLTDAQIRASGLML